MTAAPSAPFFSGKILVADDSSGDRAVARTILQGAGFAVIEACDGQEALEVAARERPDLVILDVVMPRLGGLEVCRILKARSLGEFLPVLMVSTRTAVPARVEGLRSGADDYLGKPYDAAELQARAEVLLRTRSAFSAQVHGPSPRPPSTQVEPAPAAEPLKAMADEFERSLRYSDPLALLRIELDDAVSSEDPRRDQAHAIVTAGLRKIDLAQRRSDGSALLLPSTHFPGALAVAERIIRGGRRVGLSLSVGVSFFPSKDTNTFEDMVAVAEASLARARADGGKICLFQYQGYLYAPEDATP